MCAVSDILLYTCIDTCVRAVFRGSKNRFNFKTACGNTIYYNMPTGRCHTSTNPVAAEHS